MVLLRTRRYPIHPAGSHQILMTAASGGVAAVAAVVGAVEATDVGLAQLQDHREGDSDRSRSRWTIQALLEVKRCLEGLGLCHPDRHHRRGLNRHHRRGCGLRRCLRQYLR